MGGEGAGTAVTKEPVTSDELDLVVLVARLYAVDAYGVALCCVTGFTPTMTSWTFMVSYWI